MAFFISSALASQTASKTAALEILQKLGKRPANLTAAQFQKHHAHLTIEHQWIGVRVVITSFWEVGRTVIEAVFHKGLSTILSWKKFAARLWNRATDKASGLKTNRVSQTIIKVEGSQAPGGWWTVQAHQHGLTCNCHLYKCEWNRLIRNGEAQPLLKAMFANQPQVKQFYNEDTKAIESKVQIICHHIIAAMWSEFDADNVNDYVLNYREITNAWSQRSRGWGQLSFNIPKPEIKPEIPVGSYLNRTDDWMSMEYVAWCHVRKTRLLEGEIPWTTKSIGRVVEVGNGYTAYRPSSGLGQVFTSKYDAVTYLIKNAGYTLDQVAEAFHLKQSQSA